MASPLGTLKFAAGRTFRAVERTARGELVLRDVLTNRTVATFEQHWSKPEDVVLSADASRLALGTRDTWELWDAERGERLGEYSPARSSSYPPSLSGDGTRMVAVVGGKTVLIDGGNGDVIGVLGDYETSAVVAPDGRVAVMGDHLWDLEAMEMIRSLSDGGGDGPLLRFSPDSAFVAGSARGGTGVWRTANGALVLGDGVRERRRTPYTVRWARGRVLVGRPRRVSVYSLETGDEIVRQRLEGALSFDLQQDGSTIAIASDSAFGWYDLPSGEQRAYAEVSVASVAIRPDGGQLVVSLPDPSELPDFGDVEVAGVSVVGQLRFSDDGRHILVNESRGAMTAPGRPSVIDAHSLETIAPHYDPWISGARFVDNTHLLTGGATVRRWRTEGGVELEVECPPAISSAEGPRTRSFVVFDGGKLAAVAAQDKAWVFELDTNECRIRETIELHDPRAQQGASLAEIRLDSTDVAFFTGSGSARSLRDPVVKFDLGQPRTTVAHPNGDGILTGGVGTLAWFRPGEEPRRLAIADLASRTVQSAAWRADGQEIAILDAQGDIWLYDFPSDHARRVANLGDFGTEPRERDAIALAGESVVVHGADRLLGFSLDPAMRDTTLLVEGATAMRFDETGDRLAVGIWEEDCPSDIYECIAHTVAEVFGVHDWKTIARWRAPLGRVEDIAFSPDGDRVVSVGGGLVLMRRDGPE